MIILVWEARYSDSQVFRRRDANLISGRPHLERVMAEFVQHYNTVRPHRSFNLDTPIPSVPEENPSRPVERVDRLGGLIHEYCRAA
jgi:putative transposase